MLYASLAAVRDEVIVPALTAISSYSPEASRLVIMTGMNETQYLVREQKDGPALGLFQMEPQTHDDIFENYLRPNYSKKQFLIEGLHQLSGRVGVADELSKNDLYAAAMARIFYLRLRDPLPPIYDLDAIWRFYKRFWNTEAGAATVGRFKELCQPLMGLAP